MTNWTEGYAIDVEYLTSFFRELSPSWLAFAALLNGQEPPAIDGPFAYCELGCGQGYSVNLLAAANPRGDFYGVDFMPGHVAGARALAAEAGLSNVTFLEHSFEELLTDPKLDLPEFDFITLHGVYTWVSTEVRQQIVQFIRRKLKAGGLVYVSYNAMPGWAGALPIQRLLREVAAVTPGRSDRQMARGVALIRELTSVGAGYFKDNPYLERLFKGADSGNYEYLVHEYLNTGWQPIYHADLARELEEAKLSHAGSADPLDLFPELMMTEAQKEKLALAETPALRETLRDYIMPRTFRKDIFVRGLRRIDVRRVRALTLQTRLALVAPRPSISLSFRMPVGQVTITPDVYNPILDALAERPHTVAELLDLPEIRQHSRADAVEIAGMLCGFEYAVPVAADRAGDTADIVRRFNLAVARRSPYAKANHRIGLAAASIGNGVYSTVVDCLGFLALDHGVPPEPEAMAAFAFTPFAERGETLMHDGKPIEDEDEARRHLGDTMKTFVRDRLPLYRQLGAI